MDGVRRNSARLFDAAGKLFLLALDHSQSGVVTGLEKPLDLMRRLADSSLDGFILNAGFADRMASKPFLRRKLVLRTSFGGTCLATEYAETHANHVSPETALAVGADAVLMMLTIGGADFRGIQEIAADIDAYHALGIPVVAEIIASDFARTATFDVQYHGARIAAELGADVVKAFYVEGFDRVVSCCPVPVILAGGPKDQDILDVARRALAEGASGFAFGRNIFQSADPAAVVGRLAALLGRG
jgi:putative autoinducer-2 (AI-2) aldolase